MLINSKFKKLKEYLFTNWSLENIDAVNTVKDRVSRGRPLSTLALPACPTATPSRSSAAREESSREPGDVVPPEDTRSKPDVHQQSPEFMSYSLEKTEKETKCPTFHVSEGGTDENETAD